MPLGEFMQSVLKSNKSIRLNKASRFKTEDSLIGKGELDFSDLPKANSNQLKEIKEKIKLDLKTKQIKRFILFGFIVCVVVIIVFQML